MCRPVNLKRRGFWSRLVCRLRGHDYAETKFCRSGRFGMIARLLAGPDYEKVFRCQRCGHQRIKSGWASAADQREFRTVTPEEAIALMDRDSAISDATRDPPSRPKLREKLRNAPADWRAFRILGRSRLRALIGTLKTFLEV